MATERSPATDFASATGQIATGVAWLDHHFEACQDEYVAILHAVGLEVGWHVLDAGCGSGSYLPWLADLLGTAGHLAALDLAADNVVTVEARLAARPLPCPVAPQQGSVLALPYPARQFDAVWCANTVQYLADEEVAQALSEFRRVVRPGGLVALMGFDATLARLEPGDPALRWRLVEAVGRSEHRGRALLLANLRRWEQRLWLQRAGLEGVWQRSFPIEMWAPLTPAQRTYLLSLFHYYAAQAEDVGVPADDLPTWRALADASAPRHPLDQADFHWCETHVLTVGRVPATG
ncbi:MAG: methyltransferase domain-containing protein [Chloroflexia bacterium]